MSRDGRRGACEFRADVEVKGDSLTGRLETAGGEVPLGDMLWQGVLYSKRTVLPRINSMGVDGTVADIEGRFPHLKVGATRYCGSACLDFERVS